MSLELQELQGIDIEAQKLNFYPESYEEIDGVFRNQGLLFLSKDIRIEIISCYHNNFLAGTFDIDKTRELVAYKYYYSIF